MAKVKYLTEMVEIGAVSRSDSSLVGVVYRLTDNSIGLLDLESGADDLNTYADINDLESKLDGTGLYYVPHNTTYLREVNK
jgi:hypothetical protein